MKYLKNQNTVTNAYLDSSRTLVVLAGVPLCAKTNNDVALGGENGDGGGGGKGFYGSTSELSGGC
jgi:hypothetical protein